jgi:hypothetical protein
MTDPAGVIGLVVGGNVQRASVNYSQSELFDEGSYDKNSILGRVAEHTGKLVGGLLALQVMVTMPRKDWDKAYPHHLDKVVETAQQTALASNTTTSLTEASDYYAMLSPAHDAVMKNLSDDTDWIAIKGSISETEACARSSWQNFMVRNPDILIVPGATPRSGGIHIETLRNEFEPYAQLITDLTTHPT